jgi:hypothetical protein
VDHVRTQQQRYLEPGFFDGSSLRAQATRDTDTVEQGAYPTCADLFEQLLRLTAIGLGIDAGFAGTQFIGQQIQLPDLLLNSHARQQRLYLLILGSHRHINHGRGTPTWHGHQHPQQRPQAASQLGPMTKNPAVSHA